MPTQQGIIQQKVILFDLDDTLHLAEDNLMADGWNHILQPWHFVWKKSAMAHYPPDTKYSTAYEPPGVGIATRDVIRHFLNIYRLNLHNIHTDELGVAGFNNKESLLGFIAKYQQREEFPQDELVEILEKERISYLIKRAQEEGAIKPVPGAREMVQRFHEAGYKVAVVTNSPLELANIILGKIGLVEYDEFDRGNISVIIDPAAAEPRSVEIPRFIRRKTGASVDAVITQTMVKNPKPDPEPLNLANWVLNWNSLDQTTRDLLRENIKRKKFPAGNELRHHVLSLFPPEWKPVGLVGDSGSDAGAGTALGIPTVLINTPHTQASRLFERGATCIVKSPDEVVPKLFDTWLGGEREMGRMAVLRERS